MCQFLFYHHFIITKSLSSVYIMHIITTLEECQQSFIPLLETISQVVGHGNLTVAGLLVLHVVFARTETCPPARGARF